MADSEVVHGSRPMPDFVKRGLTPIKGGGLYLKAAYAVLWFRDEHPDWSLVTEIVQADENFALMRASVLDETGRVLATGHKTCFRAAFPGGHVEKAESGAVARALAFLGYGTQFGELEEEDEAAGAQYATPRRATPEVDLSRPMTSEQRTAIESLAKKAGTTVGSMEGWTYGQAMEEIRRLQKPAQ